MNARTTLRNLLLGPALLAGAATLPPATAEAQQQCPPATKVTYVPVAVREDSAGKRDKQKQIPFTIGRGDTLTADVDYNPALHKFVRVTGQPTGMYLKGDAPIVDKRIAYDALGGKDVTVRGMLATGCTPEVPAIINLHPYHPKKGEPVEKPYDARAGDNALRTYVDDQHFITPSALESRFAAHDSAAAAARAAAAASAPQAGAAKPDSGARAPEAPQTKTSIPESDEYRLQGYIAQQSDVRTTEATGLPTRINTIGGNGIGTMYGGALDASFFARAITGHLDVEKRSYEWGHNGRVETANGAKRAAGITTAKQNSINAEVAAYAPAFKGVRIGALGAYERVTSGDEANTTAAPSSGPFFSIFNDDRTRTTLAIVARHPASGLRAYVGMWNDKNTSSQADAEKNVKGMVYGGAFDTRINDAPFHASVTSAHGTGGMDPGNVRFTIDRTTYDLAAQLPFGLPIKAPQWAKNITFGMYHLTDVRDGTESLTFKDTGVRLGYTLGGTKTSK